MKAQNHTRTVLVTGCSSGIGRHVALGLHQRGYRVFATARGAADVEALRGSGLESLQLDVRDNDSIATAVETLLAQTGGELYGLFNNAGFGQPGAVEDLQRQVLAEQFETNVFGAHEVTRRVLPAMRRQGAGRIIQNSSVLGFVSIAYRGAYSASKYALESLSDALRLELAGSGIFVSLIESGPITSRFRANAYAAFQRNIDREASVHRDVYQELEKRFRRDDTDTPFTLGPGAVLRQLIRALESRAPKPRYFVTVPTYGFAVLKRIMSSRALDRLLGWLARQERKR